MLVSNGVSSTCASDVNRENYAKKGDIGNFTEFTRNILEAPKRFEKAVILFAGGGGIECGLRAAGVEEVLSVEFDSENPCVSKGVAERNKKNFAPLGWRMLVKTVQDCTVEDYKDFINADILHASPPCQSFSQARGERQEGVKDKDRENAVSIALAIRVIKPKFFTLEQVPGYEGSECLEIIMKALSEEGYSTEYSVEDFSEYGVPQSRKRLILRAGKEEMLPLPPKNEKISWWDAIKDLVAQMEDSELLGGQKQAIAGKEAPVIVGRVGRSANRVKEGEDSCFTITASIFTDQSKGNRRRFADIVLPDGSVKSLNLRGAARIQGFPDWYILGDEPSIDGILIGNAVPPYFAYRLFSQSPIPIAREGIIKEPDNWQEMSLGEKKKWAKWQILRYPQGYGINIIGCEDFQAEFPMPESRRIQVSNQISLASINWDEGTQSRAGINQSVVREYAQEMADGAVFPPILIYQSEEGNFIVDGWHRALACQLLSRDWISADIRRGSRRDALLASCGVNGRHGLRRTNADKRKAIATLLNDGEWSKWSNREIAKRCDCDESTVRRVRAELKLEQEQIKYYREGKEVVAKSRTPKKEQEQNFTKVRDELKAKAQELGLPQKAQLLPDMPRNEGIPVEPSAAITQDIPLIELAIAIKRLSPLQREQLGIQLNCLQAGDLVGFKKPVDPRKRDLSKFQGVIQGIVYKVDVGDRIFYMEPEEVFALDCLAEGGAA